MMAESRTVDIALRDGACRLAAAGIDNARREARLLMAASFNEAPEALLREPTRRLADSISSKFTHLLRRRARREPMSQILGRREFWSLDFEVTSATLTPRPDSEVLIETALSAIADRQTPYQILDLGTGTGCLLLSLLRELPEARGIGIDISKSACRVARRNARLLDLSARATFVVGDWAAAIDALFDLVVVNPPYIPSLDIDLLMPEVRDHEPRRALDGGRDGLEAYRELLPQVRRLLSKDGSLILELGQGASGAVETLLRDNGFTVTNRRHDLAGIERSLSAHAEPSSAK